MKDCNGQPIERGASVLVFLDKPYVIGKVVEHKDGNPGALLRGPGVKLPPDPHHVKILVEVEIDIPFFGNRVGTVMRYPEPDKEVIMAVPKTKE